MSGPDAGGGPGRVVGTAGHIDHGKTELVAALTGVGTDRLPEERERGISIDLGFAPLDLGPGSPPASVVDVPGHEGFVKNMVAGASGIDAVLLVVAADEGVMPQTLEHLTIVEALGVDRGVVAVTKTDLVEREWVDLVVDTVREAIRGRELEGADIVPVSSRTGEGVERLREALAAVLREPVQRSAGFPFRLPVDRAFSVPGVGPVVTGTVWSGAIGEGDPVAVFGAGGGEPGSARVRSIEVHDRSVARVVAGHRAALALAGAEAETLGRGATLTEPDRPWRPTGRLDVRFWLSRDAPRPVGRGARVRIHHGTREVMGRAWWYEVDRLEPGGEGLARLALESRLVAAVGDRIVVRSYSPVTTIGGAEVLALDPPRLRGRARADRATALTALAAASPVDRLPLAIGTAGETGVPEAAVPLATGLDPAAAEAAREAAGGTVEVHGGRWFTAASRKRVMERIEAAVDAHHRDRPLEPALPLGAARQAAGRADPGLVEAGIDALLAGGGIERRGTGLARAGRSVELDPEIRALADRLRARYAEAGLEAPDTAALAVDVGADERRVRELQRHLEREGELVKLGSDWYADAGAVRAAERTVIDCLRTEGTAGVGTLKDLLGLTRKYLIPVLEHLDRSGVTRREGDRRVLAGKP